MVRLDLTRRDGGLSSQGLRPEGELEREAPPEPSRLTPFGAILADALKKRTEEAPPPVSADDSETCEPRKRGV